MLQIFRDWARRYFSDPQMIILGLMLLLGFAIVFLLGKILMPVAIIISVLLFGGLWGVWGVFFAIPLATLVNTVIKTWLLRSEAESGTDEADAC